MSSKLHNGSTTNFNFFRQLRMRHPSSRKNLKKKKYKSRKVKKLNMHGKELLKLLQSKLGLKKIYKHPKFLILWFKFYFNYSTL